MYVDGLSLARMVLGFVEVPENFAVYHFPSGGVEAHVYGHVLCLTAQQWRAALDRAIADNDGEKPSGPCPDCHGSGWVAVDAGSLFVCPAAEGDMDAERCPNCAG